MGRKKVVTDHTGREFGSITKMCDFWGVTPRLYSDRLKRNFTQSQALGAEKKPRKLGDTVEDIAEKYGLTIEQVKIGTQSGLSITEMRKVDTDKIVYNHEGNPFKSFNSMCKSYKTSMPTVKYRMKNGWTLEEALLGVKLNNDITENTSETEENKG